MTSTSSTVRGVRSLPLVLLLALVLVGCGGSPGAGAPGPASAPASSPGPNRSAVATPTSPSPPGSGRSSSQAGSWRAVALGDSVTAGTGCSCTAFPRLYADELSRLRGVPISVANEGAGGLTSAQLLAELDQTGSEQAQAVAAADIDLVTIGANDFSDQHDPITDGRCPGTSGAACVEDELNLLRTDLTAILRRIETLRQGRPTAVLVTGYWNVFEDGQVARDSFPDPGLAATKALTREANRAIRECTVSLSDTYVDLYLPFNGPEAGGDVSSLLAPDGDHPNARGHAVIARQLIGAGLSGLLPA